MGACIGSWHQRRERGECSELRRRRWTRHLAGDRSLIPLATRTFPPGESRDYLKAYGFQDFYYVFGYSFAIAAVLWLGAFVLWRLLGVPWWLTPSTKDGPMVMLTKLALRGLAFKGRTQFPAVTISAKRAFLVDSRGDNALVVPEIIVVLDKKKVRNDVSSRIENEAGANHVMKLWWLLLKGTRTGSLTLNYEKSWSERPQEVKQTDLTPSGSNSAIVRVASEDA